MSNSLVPQPRQTARHHSMFSFSKLHTTVSFATTAASTSTLQREGMSEIIHKGLLVLPVPSREDRAWLRRHLHLPAGPHPGALMLWWPSLWAEAFDHLKKAQGHRFRFTGIVRKG